MIIRTAVDERVQNFYNNVRNSRRISYNLIGNASLAEPGLRYYSLLPLFHAVLENVTPNKPLLQVTIQDDRQKEWRDVRNSITQILKGCLSDAQNDPAYTVALHYISNAYAGNVKTVFEDYLRNSRSFERSEKDDLRKRFVNISNIWDPQSAERGACHVVLDSKTNTIYALLTDPAMRNNTYQYFTIPHQKALIRAQAIFMSLKEDIYGDDEKVKALVIALFGHVNNSADLPAELETQMLGCYYKLERRDILKEYAEQMDEQYAMGAKRIFESAKQGYQNALQSLYNFSEAMAQAEARMKIKNVDSIDTLSLIEKIDEIPEIASVEVSQYEGNVSLAFSIRAPISFDPTFLRDGIIQSEDLTNFFKGVQAGYIKFMFQNTIHVYTPEGRTTPRFGTKPFAHDGARIYQSPPGNGNTHLTHFHCYGSHEHDLVKAQQVGNYYYVALGLVDAVSQLNLADRAVLNHFREHMQDNYASVEGNTVNVQVAGRLYARMLKEKAAEKDTAKAAAEAAKKAAAKEEREKKIAAFATNYTNGIVTAQEAFLRYAAGVPGIADLTGVQGVQVPVEPQPQPIVTAHVPVGEFIAATEVPEPTPDDWYRGLRPIPNYATATLVTPTLNALPENWEIVPNTRIMDDAIVQAVQDDLEARIMNARAVLAEEDPATPEGETNE